MQLFRQGKVRVLVCTDAAGMGCDIPDVDLVVQWKAPENLSSWVQRAGRAARGEGRTGLAVMIVKKAAFEPAAVSSAAGGRDYAIQHGLKRGMYGGQHDVISKLDEAYITSDVLRDAKGEGLYFYIQTTNCRRAILRTVFRNGPSGKPQQATRQRAPKRVAPVDLVRSALYAWRRDMKAKYWGGQSWGAQAILSDDNCELLPSVGPINSEAFLASVLKDGWA
ncbi:hypothetical protein CVT26_007520 [Gymnopilus dilepis]|uniref:RNA helicase n=1 Tax=Gymnopilus dilepis TaxID=231916 RepID=A0A409X2M3_9AGAR|nr:hypothetical protein CVT26_007520 [Gymnopilus dilepis]